MLIARVVGEVVATRKDEKLEGAKLLVVRMVSPSGKDESSYMVAIDTVDAGRTDKVLIVQGSSARMASGMADTPVDAAIVGVIDSVDVKK